MATQKIVHRFDSSVTLFECEVPSGVDNPLAYALNKAVEEEANLQWANLYGANLQGANLQWANLEGANLQGANLYGANLQWANLEGANLQGANLQGANLQWAILQWANLEGANLQWAILQWANLEGANLQWAILYGANLQGAILWNCIGNNEEIKSIQAGKYQIAYTKTHIQIGCKNYSIEEWYNFGDSGIEVMDCGALEWWKVWKPILQSIIAASPAV